MHESFQSMKLHKAMHCQSMSLHRAIPENEAPEDNVWRILIQRWVFDHEVLNLMNIWLSKRMYVLSKEKCIIDEDCFNIEMLSMKKKTWKSFDLNCTKVYEKRWVIWITGPYIPYPNIFRIRIRIIPPILLYCLRFMVRNSHHDWQVLKVNLFLCAWCPESSALRYLYDILNLCLIWNPVWGKCKDLILSSDQETYDHLAG